MAMMQSIACPINSRAFSVPHAKDSLHFTLRVLAGLLRTHHHGRCKVFINGRNKMNVMFLQPGFEAPHGLVDAAQRRSAISTDKSGCVVALFPIPPALTKQHAK